MAGVSRVDASIAEFWEAADAAGRARLIRSHGEATILAALDGLGRLRSAQLSPPGNWSIWAVLAGRGFAWLDFVDAPLVEEPAVYVLVV